MKVRGSTEIVVSKEKIWPFLTEPDKILKWYIPMQKFEYTTQQRSGVGTPFYFEEKSPMGLMKLNFVVTEWVENEKLAFKMTSGNLVKAYEQKWIVEATPSGSKFTYIEDFTLPYGFIGKILGFFGRSSSQAHVKEMLGKLKSLTEA